MTSVLRLRAFRSLAGAYTLNALLEWLGSIALMVLVYGETGSALAAAALLFCTQVVPGLLLPSIATRVEGWSSRSLIRSALLVQAAAFVLVGMVDFGAWVFLAAVALGIGCGLARSTIRGQVAVTLSGDDLRGANAALNVVAGFVLPVAPLLAGLLIGASSVEITLLVAAAGMTLSALFAQITLRDLAAAEAGHDSESGDTDVASQPLSGVPLTAWIVLGGIATCLAVIDEPSLLAYSQDSLGAGVGGYGAIATAQGIGLGLGALLFARFRSRSMVAVYMAATGLIGFAFLGMAVSDALALTCLFAAALGVGLGMDWVAITTAVQEMTSADLQRRTMTRLESAGMIGPGVGLLIGGLIGEFGSPRLALAVAGLVAIAAVLAASFFTRRRRPSVDRRPDKLLVPSIQGGSL